MGADPEKHFARLARLKAKHGNGNGAGLTLGIAVQLVNLAGWATPMAHEARLGYQNRRRGKKGSQESLTTQAVNQLAPDSDPRLSGTTSSGSRVATAGLVQLNPGHSRWLMGLPPVFCECAVMAMRSLPPKPKRSSKRTSTSEAPHDE